MAANHHLRRLASASAPALSRLSKPPPSPARPRRVLQLRLPADQPAGAAAAEKGEAQSAVKEAGEAQGGGAGARKAGEEEEEEDDGGLDINEATGEIGGPRGPSPPGTATGSAAAAARTSEE